jgi:FkbM family methyltransferase
MIFTHSNKSNHFKYWVPRDGDIFVDVGAQIGTVSKTLLGLNRNVRIIAIEPYAPCWPYLEKNLEGSNYTLVRKGVSDAPSMKTMIHETARITGDPKRFCAGWAEWSGVYKIQSEEERKAYWTSFPIEVDTLDNILSELGIDSVDFVKIDIQGLDHLAIAGFSKYKIGTKFHIETHYNLAEIMYELVMKKIEVQEVQFWETPPTGQFGAVYAEVRK